MVTLAQRISELRAERGVSGPALAGALGFPRMSIEKFEAGRQTPSQAQQEKLAAYFGVSLFYLRGETTDRTQMEDWMDGAFLDPSPAAPPVPKHQAPATVASSGASAQGSVLDSLLSGKKFQESLRSAVLDALRSPEGQALLAEAVRKELKK